MSLGRIGIGQVDAIRSSSKQHKIVILVEVGGRHSANVLLAASEVRGEWVVVDTRFAGERELDRGRIAAGK